MEQSSKLKQYKEDEIIVQDGQTTNEMYKVLSGKVAAYINYGEENECLVGIFDEQRTFGESGMLCQRSCMYTIVALEETLIMKITLDEFDEFINNNTQNAKNVIRNLAREVAVMRCNMDMMLNEDERKKEGEIMNVRMLRERMRQSVACDWNCSGYLDRWI